MQKNIKSITQILPPPELTNFNCKNPQRFLFCCRGGATKTTDDDIVSSPSVAECNGSIERVPQRGEGV